jgi:LPXTG-site transpeptidase (sortase) family protein
MPIAPTPAPSELRVPPPTTTAPAANQEQTVLSPRTPARSLQLANPVSVSIPSLHLSAKLKPLHVDARGRLVPPDYGSAGWYAAGPEPGEEGAAVIAGHLDNKNGPDVFAAVGRAKTGDRIRVRLKDGALVVFRVTQVKQFPQNHFPTKRVYGSTKKPTLRMITCGGNYDHAAGHYLDNVVVFADLAS